MKFAVDRQAFARALAVASRIVERRTTIPILSHCLIEASPGRVRVVASDLDIEAAISVPAAIERPGSGALPAVMLASIVGKIGASTVTLDHDEAAPMVDVAASRSRFKVRWLPAADFPTMAAATMTATLDMQSVDLRRMLDDVAFAMSSEEARYYLNCTFLHEVDGNLVAVATDGHRLGRSVMPMPRLEGAMPAVMVPRKTVGEIVKAAAGDTVPARVGLNDTKIRVELGELVILSKLVDGIFPDYPRVMPAAPSRTVTVDRAELATAVDLVSTVRAERSAAIRLDFEAAAIRLSMRNPDAGDASEECAAELAGEPIAVGFNSRYLAEALESFDAEMLTLGLTDPGSPIEIKNPKRDDLTVIVMPMRLPEWS